VLQTIQVTRAANGTNDACCEIDISACGCICSIRINKYDCIRNKEGCALRYYTIVIVWSLSPRIVVLNFCETHPVVSLATYRRKFLFTQLCLIYSYMSCRHGCEQNLPLHILSFSVVRGELKIPYLSI